MRYESRFLYKNGKRLFYSNDIDRAFSKKRKIITFSNGTIRGFSNKIGKQYGTVNDFKKFSIQRKTKNGTVRYGTVRKGYGDKFGRTTVYRILGNAQIWHNKALLSVFPLRITNH